MSSNVDTIRHSTDIVQVIGEVVPLKKSGANYFGACPFHNEKTPSFSVSPTRQLFHCFGCKVGGDVFQFVQLYYHWDFPQALEELARRAGIAIEVSRPDPLWDEGLQILEEVGAAFEEILEQKAGQNFRDYLGVRKIPEKLWFDFRLGAHPGGPKFVVERLSQRGLSLDIASRLGVVGRSQRGDYIDRFQGRLMFPIMDEKGRIRGFGGRSLGNEQPKYINSPKSSVFDKGRLFYGMHLANKPISKKGYAVLVEGYLDVMALFEFGVSNVLGSMGTSLTLDQIRLLKRWTPRVISLYDADLAGLAATEKNLGSFLKEGLESKVVILPDAKDPDAFLHDISRPVSERKDLLKKAFETSRPALDFLIQNSVLVASDALTRGRKLRALVSILDEVPDEIQRTVLKKDLAERFDLPERLLFTSRADAAEPFERPDSPPKNALEGDRWEREILHFMVQSGHLLEFDLTELVSYLLLPSKWGDLLARLAELGFTPKQVAELQWLDEVEPEISITLREWALEPRAEIEATERENLWKDLIKRLKSSFFQRESDRIQRELAETEKRHDHVNVRRLLGEKQNLVRLMKLDGVNA